MGEADLRDAFYAYGEVRSVKLLPDKKCAFVDYTSRDGAELAASKLHRNLVVRRKVVEYICRPHGAFCGEVLSEPVFFWLTI